MISGLDNILRDLLVDEVTVLTSDELVRFESPDDDFRVYLGTLPLDAFALNVCLVEVRENRQLRSNERAFTVEDGSYSAEPTPARLDCHYLLSAWSPAKGSQAFEPVLGEHALLYGAAAVLLRAAPINPSRVYPAGSAKLLAVPEAIRSADLPTHIAPPEGFPKLAEFWGTMGAKHPWKPTVWLTVTLPVALDVEFAGPMVTTRITEYRQVEVGDSEVWIQIGGTVRTAGGDPLGAAWVGLETLGNALLAAGETNALGRFTFSGLRVGEYQVRVRAAGHSEQLRTINVPAADGIYDVQLT
jgi:Pvc16 N-terminal domain/Carboxypeptidase regulatory-like domain